LRMSSTRRRDRASEKEPVHSDVGRIGADPEETNQPTPPGGSLQWHTDYSSSLQTGRYIKIFLVIVVVAKGDAG
ncbi:hypothetical protein T11_2574, partial [Trichinella zimbabwensis]